MENILLDKIKSIKYNRSEYQSTRVPEYQSTRVPEYQSTRVPEYRTYGISLSSFIAHKIIKHPQKI